MEYRNLLVERSDGVACITLNRPEVRNALDADTYREMRSAIQQVRSDKTVRVIVITGAGGTRRLQRIVGPAKAKEPIFTGDIIGADEALCIGLVNQVVDTPEQLIPAAREMAAKIHVAVMLAKMAIGVGKDVDLPSGLLFEKFAQTIAFTTEDRIEGTTTFLEKRQAIF